MIFAIVTRTDANLGLASHRPQKDSLVSDESAAEPGIELMFTTQRKRFVLASDVATRFGMALPENHARQTSAGRDDSR